MNLRYPVVCISVLLFASHLASASELSVGVGRVVITPETDMWMAGYAARKAPSAGKIHDLWAKAIAIEDETGARSVIVTMDLLGISAPVAKATADLALKRLDIPRDRLMLSSSHTHSGPVVRDNLIGMYDLDDEQARLVEAYTAALPSLLMQAIEGAVGDLEPGTLEWGIGEAGFAHNRRKYTPGGVINSLNPIGPVDHDVPVLVMKRANGSAKAVLFGYACHNTTLDFQKFCGDYAGFAQAYIEEKLPGVTALFAAGCGGDQNPLPRRTMTLARHYGETLGKAAIDVMESALSPVIGPLRTAYEEIPLALSPAPSRTEIEKQLESSNVYIQRRARNLLQTLDEEGALAETYPYPVQVWQFADSLQMTALGGEVVVDYALRLKHELGRDKHFVIAYANDVCAYIPSLRVLREGGYEGGDAMVHYGFHGPWAPPVEEDIVASVHRLSARRTLIDLTDIEDVRARSPLLIAHRGGVVTRSAPECSLAAIRLASGAGYDLVELDVQESKDGEPIVFHDRDLKRACGVDGVVADLTAGELLKLEYGDTGKTIQHLRAALELCKREGLGIMLDIKSTGSEAFFRRILGLLEQYELKRATMCINGAPGVREYLGGHIMLRVSSEDLEDKEKDLSGKFWFGLASELSAEEVERYKTRGALVIPAVNTFRYDAETHRQDAKADVVRLIAAGADGFQIDSVYQDNFGIDAAE